MPIQNTANHSEPLSTFKTNKRLVLLMSIIFLVVMFGLYAYESKRKEAVYQKYEQAIKDTSLVNIESLASTISSHKKNILLISELPSIQAFIKSPPELTKIAVADTHTARIKQEISLSFKALLKQQTDIRQARLILSNGSEYIRVERNRNELLTTPPNLLQSKGNRDYFKIGMTLPENELYVSPISPNYEHGKIEFPIWPTYRIIKSITDVNRRVLGLLVLNIDASNSLQQLNLNKPNTANIIENYLIDTNGYYMAAPSSSLLFGEDLDHKEMNWFIDTEHATPLISIDHVITPFQDKTYLFSSQELTLSNKLSESRYYLYTGLATSLIDDEIQNLRKELLISILGFMSLIVLIVYFFSKHIKHLEKLYLDQSRFKAIISNSSDAILSINATGKILNWNHAATLLFGMNDSEAIGQNLFNLVKTDADQDFSPSFLQDILNKNTNIRIEASPTNKYKFERFLLLTLCPIDKKDSNIDNDSIALIIRDITHQKTNQKKHEDMNTELDGKVKIRTKELEAEKQKAQRANQIKSMFVANISHEIRTPLNGVSGLLSLARDKKNHEKRDEYLKMAQDSAQTLNILINDLLDFSKIESGKLEFNPKPFNLIALLEQTVASSSFFVKDKEIELILDTSRIEIQWVLLDENRIKQIISNLLSNAIKFTNEGEVILTVSTHLSSKDDNQVICEFQVSDTGVGIAKDQQAKLFKPFIQASAGIANKFGGTGLGLSISKQLCELMHGSLTLESQSGEGSTFKATIHSKIVNTTPSEQNTEESNLEDNVIAIFVVNDQVRRVLKNQLHAWKAHVLLIQELEHFYATIKETRPHFALIDYELYNAELNKFLNEQDVNIVYITDMLTAPDLGSEVNCLIKPISPSHILSILSEYNDPEERKHGKINLATTPKDSEETIPKSEINTSEIDTKEVSNIQDKQPQTVFVVDDNEINRIVGKGILGALPVTIETAINGEDLLEKLQKLSPLTQLPVILMDCQMPILDGYAATRLIREGKAGDWLQNTPIIAMTADAMNENKIECKTAGMDDFIAKPFDPEKLKQLVSQWSNKKP